MTAQLDMFADPPSTMTAPAPASRAVLSDDELLLHAALVDVAAGREVDWQTLRHLVGCGYVHATTTRMVITDEGRAFLASRGNAA